MANDINEAMGLPNLPGSKPTLVVSSGATPQQSRPPSGSPFTPPTRVTSYGNTPGVDRRLPFGSRAGVPQNPLIARAQAQASRNLQAGYVPDTNRGVYAGHGAFQLGPGVGYMPTYYTTENSAHWRANLTLEGADRERFDAIVKAAYPKGASANQRQDLWNSGIMAATQYANSGEAVSPLDALEMMTKTGDIGSSSGGGGGGGGGGTSSFTNVSVSLTDPESAEALVNGMLKGYLGRQANAKERGAFLKALNVYERQNPTVVSGTTVSGGGSSSTTQTTTGGTNPNQFAEDWALAQEGSAEYQAATTYLNSFMSALDNPMEL